MFIKTITVLFEKKYIKKQKQFCIFSGDYIFFATYKEKLTGPRKIDIQRNEN